MRHVVRMYDLFSWSQVVIHGRDRAAIICTTFGKVFLKDLLLVNSGCDAFPFAVDVVKGTVDVQNCVVSSKRYGAMRVQDNAWCILKQTVIHRSGKGLHLQGPISFVFFRLCFDPPLKHCFFHEPQCSN